MLSTVRRTNPGFFARPGPSAKTRHICATVIKPNTVPVVIRYAFIGIVLECRANRGPRLKHSKEFTQAFYQLPMALVDIDPKLGNE